MAGQQFAYCRDVSGGVGKMGNKKLAGRVQRAFVRSLATENIRVLITGVDKDKEKVDRLLKLTKTKPAVFIGKTDIMELAALIKRCKVFVTPDSAPMHVAAAMRVPFISFFGPTSSLRHLPPAKEAIVLEKKLNCQPCYSPKCRIKTHACLREITPEDVANRVKEILAKNP